jgi:dGTPase
MIVDAPFRCRYWEKEHPRDGDVRDDYQRDRARIIHSSAFRRLQAKTQVMGVGEGDFHRTRLTHSIETGQIGEGILAAVERGLPESSELRMWLPTRELVAAACHAHDLGHPPFGHGGERALHAKMGAHGGFEGNAQTLRILLRLEKFRPRQGVNPTRRLVLAVLKYPIAYRKFQPLLSKDEPPKCYFDTEEEIVRWALGDPFKPGEAAQFSSEVDTAGKAKHRSLDCTLMECADDIAYGVHDLEDVVARRLVRRDEVIDRIYRCFADYGSTIGQGPGAVSKNEFSEELFDDSYRRKAFIGKLVHLFVTSVEITQESGFQHPLLRYRTQFADPTRSLLKTLKGITHNLVVENAEVQQLERRGQRIVAALFDEFIASPEKLVPDASWKALDAGDSKERRVCDYIAGMTDPYAQRIYQRLFTPGVGSSRDEL